MATTTRKRVGTKALPKALRAMTKKRNATVVAVADDYALACYDTQWGGGTKNDYADWNVDGVWQSVYALRPAEGQSLPMTPGYARIVSGSFCGKPATLEVYVRESDIAAFCGATCPLQSAPAGVVADWLEDNGDSQGAARVRELFC